MKLTNINWFPNETNLSDKEIILGFLTPLCDNFGYAFLHEGNSNIIQELSKLDPKLVDLLFDAFRDCQLIVNSTVNTISKIYNSEIERLLTLRGLTGPSLRYKAYLLNYLWKEVIIAIGKEVYISIKEAYDALMIFLKQLNSIIGSFSSALPELEIFKELKDSLESIINTIKKKS